MVKIRVVLARGEEGGGTGCKSDGFKNSGCTISSFIVVQGEIRTSARVQGYKVDLFLEKNAE